MSQVPAKVYHRHTAQERAKLIDEIVEYEFNHKTTWDQIARKFNVDVSTLRRWRATDEWRMIQARWRRIKREEARSELSQVAHDAIGVLQDLMMDPSTSGFTRYSSARAILEFVGLDTESEETSEDTNADLLEFLKKINKKNTTVIEVMKGGLMPESVADENKIMFDQLMAEHLQLQADQDAIDADFSEIVTDHIEDDTGTVAHDDTSDGTED